MLRKVCVALMGLMGVGASASAVAVPIIVDFTASGSACTYTGLGNQAVCGAKTLNGTVTYEVVAPTPLMGSNQTAASAINGWVNSSFVISWDTGSYVSGSTPHLSGGNLARQSATVADNNQGGIIDQIILSNEYGSYDDDLYYYNYVYMTMVSNILTYVVGLDFPTHLEMPPPQPGSIEIGRGELAFEDRRQAGPHFTGVYGGGAFTSIVTRAPTNPTDPTDPTGPTVGVSEPGSIALLGMGLLGLYACRRRSLRRWDRRREGAHCR